MAGKNILALSGGPHKDGMTAKMLDIAVKAGEKAGYNVKRIDIYDLNIGYCRGCEACNETGICVIDDDARKVAETIKESDLVILAAPVYWANVPGAVKNLFDRLVGTAMKKTSRFPEPRLKGKRYMILTSCDTVAPFSWIFGQSTGAIRAIDEFFKTAGMKPLKKIVVSGAIREKEVSGSVRKKIEGVFTKDFF